MIEEPNLIRVFKAGENWEYTNDGINLLFDVVLTLTGQTLSEFMDEKVFKVFNLNETGWRTERHEHLIYNYYNDNTSSVGPNWSSAGDQSNLFVSARDLALWGYSHLKKGVINK